MTEKRVLFGKFSFPILKGLHYLMDEQKEITDYLFINEPREKFSMYFESGQKPFEDPNAATEKEYCLFELKREGRRICFYCPERNPNRESVMWYFYVEIFDDDGVAHRLPGQIRLAFSRNCLRIAEERSQFIEILEQIKLEN